jgi:hypothetical protein
VLTRRYLSVWLVVLIGVLLAALTWQVMVPAPALSEQGERLMQMVEMLRTPAP